MTRKHRAWHAGIWKALGPLILIVLIGGLLARAPRPVQPAPADPQSTTTRTQP